MEKEKEINSLYKVLALYEEIDKEGSDITLESYLNYIDRMYVRWLGIGITEISDSLMGLWKLGKDAGHQRVKSTIFHLIGVVKDGI